MNSVEATAAVIDALEGVQIEYMLVGAFSANAYGIGRSTNDADFVVSFSGDQLQKLIERLGPEFRLDPQMQMEAFTGSFRNVVTFLPTKFQIELFRLNSQDEHHRERFRRRCRILLGEINRQAWIPTAEDVVIHFRKRSSTFFVIRSTAGSFPRSPCAQSVEPAVTTVPPLL